MSKLFSASLLRLRKSPLFWGTLALSFCFGAFLCAVRFRERLDYGIEASLDSVFFGWAVLIGAVMSCFIPLFSGTEYSDGTVRNKLTVGCTRTSVYLASLSAALTAALLFSAAYMLACAVVGVPLLGWMAAAPRLILARLLVSLALTAAYCALFTGIAMLCSRKAACAVLSMLLLLLMFLAAVAVKGRLAAPQMSPFYTLSSSGALEEHMEPNPRYLQPEQRAVYELLLDLLPAGQSIQMQSNSLVPLERPARMAACSLGLLALSSTAGAALFRRKDLK